MSRRLAVALAFASFLLPAAAIGEEIDEFPITESDRQHWSFRPLRNAPAPQVRDATWPRTFVDRFVLRKLEENELGPAPAAGRSDLLRRVTFDLTGLPPTPDQIRSFQSATVPDAYERAVDRLLASPAHGEHVAQWWLDLARFAETDGFEHDKTRPHAWKYRDWVISSLNADVPYDRFVRLQLAGDELAGDDGAVATGFCLSGPDMPDINSQEERRHTLLNELTSTVGSVFLGLQIGCAQCHDHKYDAISQADFYRLRAVFDPAVHVVKNQSIDWLKNKRGPTPPSFLMIRGDWRRRGPQVSPGVPRIANPSMTPLLPAGSDDDDAKRRSALARWITQEDHPLALRVIANRIWQFHFGDGLSDSPSDFGVMGLAPTHGDLLDRLAVELPRARWSMKRLRLLLTTSATYRQTSQRSEIEADVRNRLLSRFPRKRLTGEAIRDAMLAVSGKLTHDRGGPGVRPPLPDELVSTLLKNQWVVSPDESDHYRRSIYLFARRNLRYPIFDAFDRPDANASCAARPQSTTPSQSLLLYNSKLAFEAAQGLARRVESTALSPPERVELTFLLTLGRTPDDEEMSQSLDLVADASMVELSLALLNLNEFIYLD